jgi:Arc/MetJ family transcription regulator
MKILTGIPDDLMRELLKETQAKTKKEAVITAIKTYIILKKRQKLASLIGNYEFGYAAQKLDKMRADRVKQLTSQLQAAVDCTRRKHESNQRTNRS